MMNLSLLEAPCPCHSGLTYRQCCAPYHQGKDPEHPVLLMRARYSAYALGDVEYIVNTTHPFHPLKNGKSKQEREALNQFCTSTCFEGLRILDQQATGNFGCVVFIASLKQGACDITFTERSTFQRRKGKWFYLKGEVFRGEQLDCRCRCKELS